MVLSEDRVGEESMIQLAERYLKELGQRGMVQLKTLELPGVKGFESCRLHDLMRDLCLLQVEEESFLKSIRYSFDRKGNEEPYGSLNESSICKLRRLIISVDDDNLARFITPNTEILKHLRMFQFQFLFSDDFCLHETRTQLWIPQLNNFEILRALLIEGIRDYRRKKLPKAIGKLIHLRYLSLNDSHFKTLPSSLGNLKHMQTLDLRLYNESWRIPNILWKMKELTCLYLPVTDYYSERKLQLDGLNKLEILENFDSRLCHTEDLIRLINLRVLEVSWVEWKDLDQIAKYTQSNSMLQQVSISQRLYFPLSIGEINPMDGPVVEVLKQLLFGRNIHRLSLRVSIWKEIPEGPESSINNMSSNLVEINFKYCVDDAEETICETLAKFPHLRILRLHMLRRKEMIFQAMGFPQLREICLYNFLKLEKWVVEEGAMRNLRKLRISGCPNLEAVPDGLKHITTLEELDFGHMVQEFKDRIRTEEGQEGVDFHKISHVRLINLEP